MNETRRFHGRGRKRKQRRQEQAAGTRRRLLDSAKQLFYEKGCSATSVRSINRAIGIADGILYHYFPGGRKRNSSKPWCVRIPGGCRGTRKPPAGLSDLPLEEIIEQIYSSGAEIMEKHDVLIAIIFKGVR